MTTVAQREPVTVTISDDPATLGSEATKADLEQYAVNLQARLNDDFVGLDIEVRLGSVFRSNATHEGVEEHVRDIEGGNEWLSLLS